MDRLLIEQAWVAKAGREPVNVLTHCNAGWLATVDWGTALAPVYKAHEQGIPVHVWADETRPRNQGAALTAWELGRHGVPHTVIVDNAGGHLMQRGLVDLCIVGTDRTTRTGDVCNKIGTYLKALAAKDCGVPFYVALPGPSIDWTLDDGMRHPDRTARRRRGDADRRPHHRWPHCRCAADARRHAGAQRRLRRDTRPAGHRPDHRTGPMRRLGRGARRLLPGAGAR